MSKSIKLKNDTYFDTTGIHRDIAVGYSTNKVYLNQEWVWYEMTNANIVGKKLTLNNGRIYIGKNVKRVRVTATIFLESVNENDVGYIFGWLYQIGENNKVPACSILSGCTYFGTLVISDTMIDVQEGDYLQLRLNNDNYVNHPTASIRPEIANTRLYVEVIE